MSETLAERLALVIESSGVKQTVFARSLGVTPNYISMIVHGKKEFVSPTLALLIQQLYGFSYDWLMDGVGPKMEKSSYIKHIVNKLEGMTTEQIEKIDEYIQSV